MDPITVTVVPEPPAVLAGRPRHLRRFAGGVAVAVGLVGVVAPLALDSFGRAQAGEELVDGARNSASIEGSARLRADADLLIGGAQELVTAELPAIGDALGLSAAELEAVLVEDYPAVAAGPADSVDAGAALETIVSNLQRIAPDYEEADDLPTSWMTLPVSVALTVVTAATMLVLGVVTWRRPGMGAPLALAVVGAGAVIWLLATGSPGEAEAAGRVVGAIDITEESTAALESRFASVGAFLVEYQSEFLPDVATALGSDPSALRGALDEQFPAAARLFTDEGGAAMGRIGDDIAFRRANIENFSKVDGQPLAAYVWGSLVAFAVVAGAGAAAAVAERRSSAV